MKRVAALVLMVLLYGCAHTGDQSVRTTPVSGKITSPKGVTATIIKDSAAPAKPAQAAGEASGQNSPATAPQGTVEGGDAKTTGADTLKTPAGIRIQIQ